MGYVGWKRAALEPTAYISYADARPESDSEARRGEADDSTWVNLDFSHWVACFLFRLHDAVRTS